MNTTEIEFQRNAWAVARQEYEAGIATNTRLTRSGKPLATITTWENFASACVEAQVWENPVWPERVEKEAIALAESYGFELFTNSFKNGLHGIERVRKYARRPQEFWVKFAQELGFKFKT